MVQKTTTFVIGAGAGYEIKMPMGNALAHMISNSVRMTGTPNSIDLALEASKETGLPEAELREALATIVTGIHDAGTIDEFLNKKTHGDAVRIIGKMAIVEQILSAERNSSLYLAEELVFQRIQDIYGYQTPPTAVDHLSLPPCWMLEFGRLLTSKATTTQEAIDVFKRVTVINFNYDRCLEHFLLIHLRRLFHIDAITAADMISNLTIIHPYGTVGDLDWQTDDQTRVVDFGRDLLRANICKLSRGIMTFTEQLTDKDLQERIRRALVFAQQTIFLGFGFHKQNIDLLSTPALIVAAANPLVLGTSFGVSEQNKYQITKDIQNKILPKSGANVNLYSQGCGDLLRDNRSVIMAGA